MRVDGPRSRALATFFHLAMAIFNALLLCKVRTVAKESSDVYDPLGEIPEYAGQFKFLTHINLWVQLAYFTLQFLIDLLPPNSSSNAEIRSRLSLAFTTVIFPLACYVSLSFWAVYAYDTNLIYKEVSQLLNHLTHSAIVVWVVLEVLVCRHKFPTLSVAMVPIFTCCIMYISWVEWIYAHTGYWVYPVFKVLPRNLLYFVPFYSFSIFICLVLFLLGKAISHLLQGITL